MKLFALSLSLVAAASRVVAKDNNSIRREEQKLIDPMLPSNFCSHVDPSDPFRVGCCQGRLNNFCVTITGGPVSVVTASLTGTLASVNLVQNDVDDSYCGDVTEMADNAKVSVYDTTKLSIQISKKNGIAGGQGDVNVATVNAEVSCHLQPWYKGEFLDDCLSWGYDAANYHVKLISGTSTKGGILSTNKDCRNGSGTKRKKGFKSKLTKGKSGDQQHKYCRVNCFESGQFPPLGPYCPQDGESVDSGAA